MILKNKYLKIRLLCEITNIILLIFVFVGNIESKNLLPFVIINSLICMILNYKEDKNPKEYTKYDGIKKILTGLMIFWILIILMMIIGKL